MAVDVDDLGRQLEALLRSGEEIGRASRSKRGLNYSSYAGGFMGAYAQWCYEHRVLGMVSRFSLYTVFIFSMLAGAWFLAGTGIGKAFGLEPLRERVTNTYFAVMWSSRSNDSPDMQIVSPERYSGTIEKVVGDLLIVKYYDKGQQIRRLIRPANVIPTDKDAFGQWAMQYHLKGLIIDFYTTDDEVASQPVWRAVLWHKQAPINVELVEHGIGYPEKNPPTAVVNQIFSQYYWYKAKEGL